MGGKAATLAGVTFLEETPTLSSGFRTIAAGGESRAAPAGSVKFRTRQKKESYLKTSVVNMDLLLDMSNNQLTGEVPSHLCSNSSSLTHVMLSLNPLSGPIDLEGCRNLISMDIHSTQINGSFPQMRGADELRYLRIDGSLISGVIAKSTVFPAKLANLRLADTWQYPLSISKLLLNDNCLYGTIPDSFAHFAKRGVFVNLSMNYLHCCGVDFNGNENLAIYAFYNKSAPSCPAVILSDAEDIEDNHLTFYIDPEYYFYEGCICEEGFRLKRVEKNDTLQYEHYLSYGNFPTCESYTAKDEPKTLIIAIVLPTVIPIFILAVVYFTCFIVCATAYAPLMRPLSPLGARPWMRPLSAPPYAPPYAAPYITPFKCTPVGTGLCTPDAAPYGTTYGPLCTPVCTRMRSPL
eukprot:gene7978-1194_t